MKKTEIEEKFLKLINKYFAKLQFLKIFVKFIF